MKIDQILNRFSFMDEFNIYLGAFTDFTYDLTNEDKEVDPVPSSIPESVLNLTKLIYENNEQQEKMRLKKEKLEKIAIEQAKSQKFRKSTSMQLSGRKVSLDSFDDTGLSDSSSSSSADFEIESLQKQKKDNKVPKVPMNRIIYSFSKPEPEVRRMFVTSRAPRSKNNDKATVRRERIHLAARLSSRRKVPISSMVHQHELMLVDISDLEKK